MPSSTLVGLGLGKVDHANYLGKHKSLYRVSFIHFIFIQKPSVKYGEEKVAYVDLKVPITG